MARRVFEVPGKVGYLGGVQRLTSFFLYAFYLDGLLSAVEEVLKGTSYSGLMGHLPSHFALGVLILAALLYLGMSCTPRLSKRILLPPMLFEVVSCVVMFFAPSSEQYVGVLNVVQMALGAGLIVYYRDRSETGKGRIGTFVLNRPAFTWRNLFGWMGANTGLALLLLVGGVVAGCEVIEHKTGGYLRVMPTGVFLEECRFQRGEQEVRLIGTIHVAQRDFYQELSSVMQDSGSAVVLLEGVTDHENRLKQKLNYAGLASMLGVAQQTDSAFQKDGMAIAHGSNAKGATAPESTGSSGFGMAFVPGEVNSEDGVGNTVSANGPARVDYWSADLDVSAFQPKTIRYMEAVGEIFSSHDGSHLVKALSDPNSPFNDKTKFDPAVDLEDKRNAHLAEEMERALRSYNLVIVPWGAVHMPVMQHKLEEWGFKQVGRVYHQAFEFDKVRDRLKEVLRSLSEHSQPSVKN